MADPIGQIGRGLDLEGVTEAPKLSRAPLTGNIFEDVLSRAVESLEKVSNTELYANQLIEQYIAGKADLQDVMVATSKMSLMVQLAVTTITTAVNTFKEITQMQV
ncbi:MAG: flagellar hook-basal body complex protein FliE [Candidatus Saganbacteria bacterium]|nr:flagellar hook-basal body complex protein FliE [Candidatus Saganbacteria bacterium]